MTPYSRSVPCITASAVTSMRPSTGRSGPEILWAPSTASGGQPSVFEQISAASLGFSRISLSAVNIARMARRIGSACVLMASSDAYWIWLIHFPVTASKRSSTLDLPWSSVTAPPSPHT